MNRSLLTTTVWLLRLSLAAAFLSAVVDRLGGWGLPGAPNVAWGAWGPFIAYTGKLLWFLPASWVSACGLMATVSEAVLAVWLLLGFKPQFAALASAALLLTFALTMTVALGIKAPLDYSVFTSVAAALALACIASPERRNS